jgi:Protein of unknown function (DUF3489)
VNAFTIENETNNIMIHPSTEDAAAVPNAESFGNEITLAELAANWPTARLIEIWNGLPGETPVKKFRDRASAISRIWKAIQYLGLAVPVPVNEPALSTEPPRIREPLPAGDDQAEPVPGVGGEPSDTIQLDAVIPKSPEDTPATSLPPQTLDVASEAAPAKSRASRAKKAPKPATEASGPREGSKTSQVIAMLKREGGATVEEIMAEMTWQKHTTRALLSAGGSLTKKHGLIVTSEKVGEQRMYSIKV